MRPDFSPFSERGEHIRVPDSEQGGVPTPLPGHVLLSDDDDDAQIKNMNKQQRKLRSAMSP